MGLSRRAQGWLTATNTDGTIEEADTFTCAHCQRIVPVRPKADPYLLGGFCRQCDAMICSRCVDKDCMPFMRKIEQMEEQYYRRRQLEQMVGL